MTIEVAGQDGAGKTEVARFIENTFGFHFIEKPIRDLFDGNDPMFYRVLDEVYKYGDTIRSWFFSLGNIMAAQKYNGENVVIDRHFVSNYYWNASEGQDPIFKTMIDLIGKPDLTIVVYATPQTRIERMKKRNPNDSDLSDLDIFIDGYGKMIKFLDDFSLPYVVIRNENKTIEELHEEIRRIVEECIKQNREKKRVKGDKCE